MPKNRGHMAAPVAFVFNSKHGGYHGGYHGFKGNGRQLNPALLGAAAAQAALVPSCRGHYKHQETLSCGCYC